MDSLRQKTQIYLCFLYIFKTCIGCRRRRYSRSRSRSRRRSYSRSRSRSPRQYRDATYRYAGHYVPGRFSGNYHRAGFRGGFRGGFNNDFRGRGGGFRGGFRDNFHHRSERDNFHNREDRFHFVKRSPPGRLREGESATAEMFAKLKKAKEKIEDNLQANLKPEEVEKLMAGKWASSDADNSAGGAAGKGDTLKDTEEFIAKGMAEKKKEMLERNKHLLKNASAP